MAMTPSVPASAPADLSPLRPRRKLMHHLSVITGAVSVLNGIAVLVLTTCSAKLGPVFMGWVSDWWGLVEGIVVLLQLPPLVASMPLEERKEITDVVSSVIDAGIIWLVVPAIYVTSMYFVGHYSPGFYIWKIWVTSLPASLVDLLLLLVMLEIAKTVQRFSPSP